MTQCLLYDMSVEKRDRQHFLHLAYMKTLKYKWEKGNRKKAWKYTAHHHYHNSYFLGKTKINVENNSGGPNVNICKIQTESTVWNTLQLIWSEENMLTVCNKTHIATSRSLLSCGIDWSKQKLNRIHILQT